MKKPFTLMILFLVVTSAMAAPYRSFVITTTALTINVAADNFIVIRNFTQEGGATRGLVTATFTSSGGTTATANVLNAAMINTSAAAIPETINVVTVSGPVAITVQPVAGATQFITVQKASQPD